MNCIISLILTQSQQFLVNINVYFLIISILVLMHANFGIKHIHGYHTHYGDLTNLSLSNTPVNCIKQVLNLKWLRLMNR